MQDKCARVQATPTNLAFDSNVVAGNMLVAILFRYDYSGVYTIDNVTDSQGNTWAAAGAARYSANVEPATNVQIWTTTAGSSAACTVRAYCGSEDGNGCDMYIAEVGGSPSPPTAVDVYDTSAGQGTTSEPIVTLVTTVANDFLIGRSGSSSPNNAAGSGFTAGDTTTINLYDISEYKADAGTEGSTDVAWQGVYGASHYWIAAAAALKAEEAEPPPPPGPPLLGQACL